MTLTTTMLNNDFGSLTAADIQTIKTVTAKDIKALTGLTTTMISSLTSDKAGFTLLPAAALKGLTTTQTAALESADVINAMLNPDALDFGALTTTALEELNVSTLEKAKNSLAEITVTQAASLSTTTFSSLSTTAIQKLKPEVIDALTATLDLTIDKFSNKQLGGLTTTAVFTVNDLTPEKFKYLSTTLTAELAEASAPHGFAHHMSKEQLATLTNNALLDPDRFEGLPLSDFPHLSTTYLASELDATSIHRLDKSTVAKMPLSSLTATALNAFNAELISALKPAEIKKLNIALTGPSNSGLSKAFLEALTVTQKQAMPADIIANFIATDFNGLGGTASACADNDGLTTTWVSSLSSVQIEALTGLSTTIIGCAFGTLD